MYFVVCRCFLEDQCAVGGSWRLVVVVLRDAMCVVSGALKGFLRAERQVLCWFDLVIYPWP